MPLNNMNIIEKQTNIIEGESVEFKKGLCWPTKSYLQVHASNETLEYINTINKEFEKLIIKLSKTFPLNTDHQQLVFDPNCWKYTEEMLVKNRTSKMIYSVFISRDMYLFINDFIPKNLPEVANSYYKALKYAENTLKDRCIAQLKPSGLLGFINNIHTHIANLPKHSYRNSALIVYKNNILNNGNNKIEDVDNYMKRKCTKPDLFIWENSFRDKIKMSYFTKPPVRVTLNADDVKILSTYLAGPTPDAVEVSKLMTKFSEDLLAKLQKCNDVIELMAWSHQKIVSIHPYEDCNGRVARTFMNIIALQAGKEPILFDNEADYEEAVGTDDFQKFATYLRGLEKKQVDLNNFTQGCVEHYFKRFCESHKIK